MDQYLRVSAISSYLKLRKTLAENPLFTVDDARRFLSAKSHAGAELDWVAAEYLNSHLTIPELGERSALFQSCILRLVEADPPAWINTIFSGRDVAARSLDADIHQCFQVAGAFEPIPSASTVQWMDKLARLALVKRDERNLAVGREAERFSLEYEQRQLDRLGIDKQVEWVALNENFAGYDIKSWTKVNEQVVPKLIEVKGCADDTCTLYISRNEWDTGSAVMCPYVFQIWMLASGRMKEISVDEMRLHIPVDNGGGDWQSVKIHLG